MKTVLSFVIGLLTLGLASSASAQGVLPSLWDNSPIGIPNSVAYAPDNKLIAIGGLGGVHIFNVFTSYNMFVSSAIADVTSVAFSPNGKMVAGCGCVYGAGMLEFWNSSNGALIGSQKVTGNLDTLAFAPNGQLLCFGGAGAGSGVLGLWNVSSGSLQTSLNTEALIVDSVAFSPDSKTLCMGGWNAKGGLVELWDVSTGTLIRSLSTAATNVVKSVAFCLDNKTLAVGGCSSSTGVVELWTYAKGVLKESLKTSASSVTSVAFSHDSKSVGVGGIGPFGGVLELWTISTEALIASLGTSANQGVSSIVFSPNGKTIADCGTYGPVGPASGVVETWSLAIDQRITLIDTTASPVNSIAFSPDGNSLAIGGETFDATVGSVIGVLDLVTTTEGDEVLSLNTSANCGVMSIAFSQDGGTMVAGGRSFNPNTGSNGVLEVWDVLNGSLVEELKTTASYQVNSVVLSTDGGTLADGGLSIDPGTGQVGGVVEAWDIATGEMLASLNTSATNGVRSVSLSPDGSTLAVAGAANSSEDESTLGVLELWDVSSAQLTALVKTGADVLNSVAFSADGTVLAAGGSSELTGGVLELWGVSTGKELAVLPLVSGTAIVNSVAFSPDGSVLMVGTSGVATNLQMFSLGSQTLLSNNYDASVNPVAVSATGSMLAYGTQTGALVVSANPYFIAGWLQGISVSPANTVGGLTTTGTVTLGSPAPAGGTLVNLTTNSPFISVPPSVTVAGGATTALFSISVTSVSGTTPATISATEGSTSMTAALTIAPVALSSLSIAPSALAGGTSALGTVILNGPAGTGGVRVALSSNAPATVPVSVTIEEGQSSATFAISTNGVTSQQTATIKAIYQTESETAPLTVNPTALQSVMLNPATQTGGQPTTGTLTLTGLAPGGGLVVHLAIDSSDATLPSTVIIAEGKSSANFKVDTISVTTQASAMITATLGAVSKNAYLTINPASLVSISVNPTSVAGGSPSTGTVTLSGVAAAGGTVVRLSTNQNSVILPASITIVAGKTSAAFSVGTIAVGTQTIATIRGSVGLLAQSTTLTIAAPTLKSVTLSPSTVAGGKSSTGTVTITSIAPVGGLVVSISSSQPSATVPTTVTIPAGKTSADFEVETTTVSSKTTVTISATFGSASKTAVLTIT